MTEHEANARMVTRLMFRLLPAQILISAVGAVNGIVSSFFASNYVGVNAMSAVGLYSPVNMFFSSVSLILVGGSVILCGKYMGRNQQEELQGMKWMKEEDVLDNITYENDRDLYRKALAFLKEKA